MESLMVNMERTDSKLHFEGVSLANPGVKIPFDYIPPLGTGSGFAGLEMLLMSFSGCVSTTVVFLLQRLGKHVASYSASAEGIRTEHPLSLKEVHFQIRIQSEDVTESDMQTVIRQAEAVSPVWQAVKNNITVSTTFELRKE